MEINGERYWTLNELAKEICISRSFLRSFVHPKGIPTYRFAGQKAQFFKLDEAWDFLMRRVKGELTEECTPPRSPSKNLRLQVFERDHYRCRYCGQEVHGRRAQTDHIQAFRRGGLTTLENLVTACISCNKRKKDSTPEEAGMTLLPVPEKVME